MKEKEKLIDQQVPGNLSDHLSHNILLSTIFVAGLLFSAASPQSFAKSPENKPVVQQMQQTVQYTCPNHPEVVQDKPGNCPICGTKLVEKKPALKGNTNMKQDSVKSKKMMRDTTGVKKNTMKRDSTYLQRQSK